MFLRLKTLRKTEYQRGAALMVMLVIMVLGTVAFLVKALNSASLLNARDQTSNETLAQAKAALISYAATYGDIYSDPVADRYYVHGYLPCPDQGQNSTQDGEANSSCGAMNVSQIGKLPWKTIGLPVLKDGNDECLWYAVSGTYKNNPQTLMMNEDTIGLFEVFSADGVNHLAGSSIDNRAVAVIFAPGVAQSGQSRASVAGAPTCGGNYTASNYMDNDTLHNINNTTVSATANTVSQFISGPIKAPGDTSLLKDTLVNDRMIVITRSDIFNAIYRRKDFVSTDPNINPLLKMTKKAAECMADYGRRNNAGLNDKRLPWAARAPTNPLSATDLDCNSTGGYRDGSSTNQIMFGRLPNRVSGSRSSTTGTNNQITSQTYASCSASYYQFKSYPTISSSNLNCPSVPDWNTYYPWWSNWKDHVFYTLSNSYRPAAGSNPSCGTCLHVNGAGNYPAIVMFAGSKLASQSRTTDADRLNFSNYLEGNNLKSNVPVITSGDGNYQSGAATSSFNDVLYCINSDLSVTPCP